MKRFALIGAAGYIAPRHMKAIKDTGNELVAAMDPNDSVGIIDSYFPDAAFFTEFERFDRHLDKIKRSNNGIDYLVICSPNYLHDAHIRFGLRLGAQVICEKPMVINPWNIDGLQQLEKETGSHVYNILQLRHHESIQNLKKLVDHSSLQRYQVNLEYITARGQWYHYSWKANEEKSGGITTNIGIHFFDILQWIFGAVKSASVSHFSKTQVSGNLILENADVKWNLSIDVAHLPKDIQSTGLRTYRSLMLNGEEIRFDKGFEDLHLLSYKSILSGQGYGISDAQPAIDIVHQIRKQIESQWHNH